ncbi:MAG: hypothetical protein KAJ18_12275, partial [Candidatus Omnitrophica bacterium]|nr:hypothetical protein [Candidatus Omnitrophota bacterium]
IVEYEAPGCFGGHVHAGGEVDPARGMLLSKIADTCTGVDALVMPCPNCYRAVKHLSSEPATRIPPVMHPLEFLVMNVPMDKLRAKRTRSIKGLRVSPFYGCLFRKCCGDAEESEKPQYMEDFFEKLGLDAVWFPESNECCGGPKYLDSPDALGALSKRILDSASNWGIDIISVACAQCYSLLEGYGQSDKIIGEDEVVVMYYSQVAGYLMGLDKRVLFPSRKG